MHNNNRKYIFLLAFVAWIQVHNIMDNNVRFVFYCTEIEIKNAIISIQMKCKYY